MRILVTGATGFAGGYIIRYLRDQLPGVTIAGTGRNYEKAIKLEEEGFKIYRGDLSDPVYVSSELESFTHIVHCAARSSIWGNYNDFYRDNVVCTSTLLNSVPSLERFIFISTANIYFDFSDRFGVSEDDPLPASYVSCYPRTKLMAEREVLSFNRNGVHTTSLRPRGIIGPGDTTSMPRIMKAYLDDKIKIVGSGRNVVDFTSIGNLAHAVKLSLTAGENTRGEAYNITDGEVLGFWSLLTDTMKNLGYEKKIGRVPYPVVYLAALISEMVAKVRGGYEPTLTRYAAGVMKASFTLSIEKAKRDLGYSPVISSGDTINEFLEWYKSNGL